MRRRINRNEADQAIAGYNAEQRRLNSLSRARSAALDAVRLSTDRYERGLTDFLNVLDAERQRFEIEAQYEIISLSLNLTACPFVARNGHAEAVAGCPLLRDERT